MSNYEKMYGMIIRETYEQQPRVDLWRGPISSLWSLRKRTIQAWGGILCGLLCLEAWPVRVQAAVLQVPHDYPSIQASIAAARAGDTVLVAPGIYFESVVMKPGVHIHGRPGAILDGSQESGAVVSAWSGIEATAILSGFVIRRGKQAGILLNQASPTLRNNIITEHQGAGIACLQASPQILNNIITHNAQGGILCRYPGTAPLITSNNFWQNQPSTVVDCPLGEGNRAHDPQFVNAQLHDYRLQDTSPLIDAGHPGDIFNDADGSRSDMGVHGGPQPQPRVQQDVAQAPELLRNSVSFQGLPGLIDIPTATMIPDGYVDLNYNVKRDFNVFPTVDEQQNFSFAIGLLPRVTIGGRGTVANPDTGPFIARDISTNLQLLLLEEGPWWPAVAVGFQDLGGGAQFFESNFLVLSKSLFGRLRGTVGFGTGPDTLDGLFGGVELALHPLLTLMAEYDTDHINAGLRLFPLPQKFEAYGIPRPVVDLIWQDGDDFAWGISVRAGIGEAKYRAQRAARTHKRYHRWMPPVGEELSLQAMSQQLQARLIADGMENVRVAMVPLPQGITVVVEYENRRYNRDELDGLGVVMGLTAIHVPPAVTSMRIIVKEVNLPVLQVTTSIDDFLAYVNEQMSEATFAHHIHMTHQIQRPSATTPVTTATRNRSWFKVDAVLEPGIETRILTETTVAAMRFSLLPNGFMHLTPGTVVNVAGRIPVTQTGGFPGDLGDPELFRVVLNQAVRLPVGQRWPIDAGLSQFSIGRFNPEEVGIANETVLTFLQGWLFFKSSLARFGSSFSDLDRWLAAGNIRLRYPKWDLMLSIRGGQFLDGDRGINTTLSRLFGTTRVSVFLWHTNNGSLGGITVGFPLSPPRDLKPTYFRPRLPDLFTYSQSTTVFTDRNLIRGDIGRLLGTGHAVETIYWNRDQLYPVSIRQHLDTLKQAVRRWVDEPVANAHTHGRK